MTVSGSVRVKCTVCHDFRRSAWVVVRDGRAEPRASEITKCGCYGAGVTYDSALRAENEVLKQKQADAEARRKALEEQQRAQAAMEAQRRKDEADQIKREQAESAKAAAVARLRPRQGGRAATAPENTSGLTTAASSNTSGYSAAASSNTSGLAAAPYRQAASQERATDNSAIASRRSGTIAATLSSNSSIEEGGGGSASHSSAVGQSSGSIASGSHRSSNNSHRSASAASLPASTSTSSISGGIAGLAQPPYAYGAGFLPAHPSIRDMPSIDESPRYSSYHPAPAHAIQQIPTSITQGHSATRPSIPSTSAGSPIHPSASHSGDFPSRSSYYAVPATAAAPSGSSSTTRTSSAGATQRDYPLSAAFSPPRSSRQRTGDNVQESPNGLAPASRSTANSLSSQAADAPRPSGMTYGNSGALPRQPFPSPSRQPRAEGNAWQTPEGNSQLFTGQRSPMSPRTWETQAASGQPTVALPPARRSLFARQPASPGGVNALTQRLNNLSTGGSAQ